MLLFGLARLLNLSVEMDALPPQTMTPPAAPPGLERSPVSPAPGRTIDAICLRRTILITRPALLAETASYRVSYGILGEVAQGTITFAPQSSPGSAGTDGARSMIHAVGDGQGAVLGFGNTSKHIESDFDVQTLTSTRWTSTRTTGAETVIDSAEQQQPGVVSLLRKRAGNPDQVESVTRSSAVLDPLGLLLRIRLAPPKAPTTFELLDGRALWLMSFSAAQPTNENPRMLRLDGRAEPIYWNGTPDNDRTARSFTFFLSDDAYRNPLRLVVPFGPGEAHAELSGLSRPGSAPRRKVWGGFLTALMPCRARAQ